MKRKLHKIGIAILLFAVLASPAYATNREIDFVGPGDDFLKYITPDRIVAFIINAFFALAVIAALVYLLWGGLNWILSGGDKEKIDAARSRIIAAIIGLVLVVLAYVILNFVMVILGFGGISGLTLPTLREPGAQVEAPPATQ